MLTINLRKVGGSIMFPVPRSLLESLGLHERSSLNVSVVSGSLVAQPQKRKKYRLEDLISQCDLNAQRSIESDLWLNDEPVGNEAI
jgi:antitoxin ChpS